MAVQGLSNILKTFACISLLALATLSLKTSFAQTDTTINLRAAEHPGFGRLVVDSLHLKPIRISQTADRVWSLTLSNSLRIDPGLIVQRLPNYVERASLDSDGLVLTLTLRDRFQLERSNFGAAQIFDWFRERAAITPANQQRRSPPKTKRKSTIGNQIRLEANVFRNMARITLWGNETLRPKVSTSDASVNLAFDSVSIPANDLRALASLKAYLSDYSLADDGRTLHLSLKDGIRTSTLRYLNSYIIDLSSAQDSATSVDLNPTDIAPSSTELQAIRVRLGRHPDYVRLVFDWPEQVNYLVEHRNDQLDISFGQETRFNLPSIPASVAASIGPLRQETIDGSSRVTTRVPQSLLVQHQRYKNRIIVDVLISERNPVQDFVDNLTNNAAPVVTESTLRDSVLAVRDFNLEGERKPVAHIPFNWIDPVGAALFQYRDYVWVIFDSSIRIDEESLQNRTDSFFEDILIIPNREATAIRLKPKQRLFPSLERVGFTWVLRFDQDRPPQTRALNIENLGGSDGQELHVPTGSAGKTLSIIEPDTYERLLIGTVKSPGYALKQSYAYPGLQLPVSLQGVFGVAIDEGIEISERSNRFIFSRPGGLAISPFQLKASENLAQQSILNLKQWEGIAQKSISPSYITTQLLLDQSAGHPARSLRQFLELYFAIGYFPEAYNIAKAMEPSFLSYASQTDPGALMLLASSAVMRRDRDMVRVWINRPEIRDLQETSLWRGVDAALHGDWQSAQSFFENSGSILFSYSNSLIAGLSILRLETLIENQDREGADIWLNNMDVLDIQFTPSQKRWYDYLQGRLAFQRDQKSVALKVWDALATDTDRAGNHAQFELLKLQSKEDDLVVDDLINQLESLAISWRGDSLELQINELLAQLYARQEKFDEALTRFRKILTYFPEHQRIISIRHDMLRMFRSLFLNEDRLPVLKLLAIHQQFRELVPTGPDGNRLTEILADRLFEQNYFTQSREIYDRLFTFRLKNVEKQRMAVKLAMTDLALDDYEHAQETLDKSNVETLPVNNVRRQDVRLLQSYLLASREESQEALNRLSGVISLEADLLRRDIALRDEDWPALILALERLTGPPPQREDTLLPGALQRHLISWATALRRMNDNEGLAELAQFYRPFVPDDAVGVLFDALTDVSNSETISGQNILQSLQQINTIAPQTSFLSLLRNRYFIG